MNDWLELIAAVALAAAGALAGRRLARVRPPWWLVGYLTALGAVLLVGLARRFVALAFTPPLHLLVAGRTDYLLLGFCVPLLFATLIARLENRRLGVLLGVLGSLVLVQFTLLPYIQPFFLREKFARLTTVVNADGVCLQSEFFTCGPAAAVTLLRRLGLRAEEGELAIAARTCAVVGTPPDELADMLTARYAPSLTASHRLFADVDALARAPAAIAVIRYLFMVDHYVAVLAIDRDQVVIGDPLKGKRTLSRHEFERIWRGNAVVLEPAAARAPR